MRAAEQERELARRRVADHLTRTVAGLSATEALEIMAVAGVRHLALHAVDRHLTAQPDALLAGDANAPLGLHRLVQTLSEAGFAVTPITCSRCGRLGQRLAWLTPDGRVCRRCARQSAERELCARCGRRAVLEGRRPEGAVCGTCTATDPATFDDCAGCGQHARPFRRLPGGEALCQRCAPRPARNCTVCGQNAPPATNLPAGPICARCYPKHAQPHRACTGCGRRKPIHVRATADHGDLCVGCAPKPTGTCSRCHQDRSGWSRDSEFVCNTCRAADRPIHVCVLCHHSRPANAVWPIGPVCASCYRTAMNRPQPCQGCGRLRVLIGRLTVTAIESPPDLCGPCSNSPDYACTTCDTPGAGYADRRCARCTLAIRLRTAFTDETGQLVGQYATLVTVLAASNQPESLLSNWLTPTHPAVELLTRLARSRTTLTHELLDDLPQTPQLRHLRRLLTFAAVLPPRPDEYLCRLGPWLRDQLIDLPAHHLKVIHPYAEWDVLHRARRRALRQGRFTHAAATYTRARISAAISLLSWLDEQHATLDRLNQGQLDKWLDNPRHRHQPIGDFLRWAARARQAQQLDVPPRRRDNNAPSLDEQQRWRQLRRCLHDEALPTAVRVVGALTLLYGVTTARILELTTTDVEDTDGTVHITFGTCPAEVPPTVARLLLQQHEYAESIEINGPELSRWLLPGHLGVQPIHPAHMSDQLATAGLHARAGRHAALADLAAALPPAVLAPLLGIHIGTAITWSHRAQHNWADYLASRAIEQATHTNG